MNAVMGVVILPPSDPSSDNYADDAKATRRLEAQRRHAMELHEKVLASVQDLEVRIGIAIRWTPQSLEWDATAVLVGKRRYQRALDKLQGLVIARMFELTKMNMSGTGMERAAYPSSELTTLHAGYKLRKHIAKALQARSRAVKTALGEYNIAAGSLTVPRPSMTWEQVVEYTFLSDFDLLREGREDIREEAWAKPASRIAMDQYFKFLRSQEEIHRLNIEIPRFLTYMSDEEAFLWREEQRIRREGDNVLGYQVGKYRMRQGRFNDGHRDRLIRLSKVPGFSASMLGGRVPIDKQRLAVVPEHDRMPERSSPEEPMDTDADAEANESDEDDLAETLAAHFVLLTVTEDGGELREGLHASLQDAFQT